MREMLEIDSLKWNRTTRPGAFFISIGFLVLSFALLACGVSPRSVANQGLAQSECVICHTNAERLVTLAREMEKVRLKPGPSPESTGEC